MRYFFDTEFIENGISIRLLSIGVVAEDGREYYAETHLAERVKNEFVQVDPWLMANVVPHLRCGDFVKTRTAIAQELIEFVGPEPEFWAYFADYDWVALCQLYGRMIDLPPGWPMYCRDLRQALDEHGLINVKSEPTSEDGAAHDALADARANLRVWREHVAEMKRLGALGGWVSGAMT